MTVRQSHGLFALAFAGALLTLGTAQADTLVDVVLLGDGYINGLFLNPPDRFATRLKETMLSAGTPITTSGPGARKTSLLGLNWLADSEDGLALRAAPAHHAAIVELGVLDCRTDGAQLTLDETRANLGKILAMLADAKIPVLLVGQKAYADCGSKYFDQFNAMYPEIARQYGVPLFPDFLDVTYGHPELLQEGEYDAPNPDGIRAIAAKMLPMVQELIQKVDQP